MDAKYIYYMFIGGISMPDYASLYRFLFNAITDALRQLDAGTTEDARDILIQAQVEAEERYLAEGE